MNRPILLAIGGGLVTWLLLDVFHRFASVWWASRIAKRISGGVQAGDKAPRRDAEFAVSFNSVGFTVTALTKSGLTSRSMTWITVERAIAFKRDLWAYDCICLFVSNKEGTGFEVDEEMVGWGLFVETLPAHLAGCKKPPEWLFSVADPPFETNVTEIFARHPRR